MDSGPTSALMGFGVLAAALVACAMTNPTKQDHLNAISDKNGLVGGIAQVASFLGGVEYNNYIVRSTLTADSNTLTFGILKDVVVGD
jgi:dihydroxyacetone kinase